MQRSLPHTRNELERARRALNAMKGAPDPQSFEFAWRDFLNSIEKVWVKAERECQPIRQRFLPWQGRYQALRKKDPLLRYLKHAKNADQHSDQEVIEMIPGSKSFGPVGGGPWHIDRLVLTGPSLEVSQYRGNKPLQVKVTPPRIDPLPVRDSGDHFDAPSTHLGLAIVPIHPIRLAELGLEFYSKFVQEIQTEFFPEP